MAEDSGTPFSCTCGQLHGHIANLSPKTCVHAICFCEDCRAAEVYHKQPDPGETGVDLVMVDPANVHIDGGQEHLAAIRIYPKGIIRWYADCCGARLFNTVSNARFVFITVVAARIPDTDMLGPVQARAFVKQPDGSRKHENGKRLFMPMALRSLARFLSGRWRDNPLFDRETGQMVVTPHILTREERREIGLGSKTTAS